MSHVVYATTPPINSEHLKSRSLVHQIREKEAIRLGVELGIELNESALNPGVWQATGRDGELLVESEDPTGSILEAAAFLRNRK